MDGQFPAFDVARGLMILKENGIPSAQPCGDCPEWSIYGVCWREGGCGAEPCVENVPLSMLPYTSPGREGCEITKFLYTATKLGSLDWGPVAAPLTGTVRVEFTVDGVSVHGPSEQNVVETIEYSDSYAWPDPTFFSSGWHSCKAFVVWTDGEQTIRETYAVCVYAGIRPSGENALALHDVVILPGNGVDVCIDETLRAVKFLGPYRHHDDADYVRQQWAAIIDTWAERCLCPGTCESGTVDRNGGFTSTYPVGNTNVSANLIAEGLGFIACTPSQYPIYVKFGATFIAPSGVSLYMKYYDEDDNETGETEIFDATAYDFTVPPCTRVEFIVVNSNEEEAVDVAIGFSLAYYSNFPDPDTWQTDPVCPYEQDITDMVPSDAAALVEWLEAQP